jgi:hypothetical protein
MSADVEDEVVRLRKVLVDLGVDAGSRGVISRLATMARAQWELCLNARLECCSCCTYPITTGPKRSKKRCVTATGANKNESMVLGR